MSDFIDLAKPSLTDRTTLRIREVLAGRRRGLGSVLLFAGPAVIVSIAYMDPAITPPTSRPVPPSAMACSGWC